MEMNYGQEWEVRYGVVVGNSEENVQMRITLKSIGREIVHLQITLSIMQDSASFIQLPICAFLGKKRRQTSDENYLYSSL